MSDAHLTLLRHATVLIELAGQRILVDPMLDPAGAREAVPYSVEPRPNPLVELPAGHEAALADLDAVLVTHLHEDHLDAAGAAWLAEAGVRVLCQPEDVAALRGRGIDRVEAVGGEGAAIGPLRVARTGGEHGTGELAAMLAPVSGFVLADEAGGRVVYLAGDTVWCDPFEAALVGHRPTTIVLNAGGARLQQGDPITMTPADLARVAAAAPATQLIAVHMDAINHCVDTRDVLAAAPGAEAVVAPADGERVALA